MRQLISSCATLLTKLRAAMRREKTMADIRRETQWIPSFEVLEPRHMLSADWVTFGEAEVADDVITLGDLDGTPPAEVDTQTIGLHGASVRLAPDTEYSVSFTPDLHTWDSYYPDFGPGTGYWDAFSVSITDEPYPELTNLSDPLSFPNAFVWGGTQFGDGIEETYAYAQTLTVSNPGGGEMYLNVVLDTLTDPDSDDLYPSWGTFTITAMPSTLPPVGQDPEVDVQDESFASIADDTDSVDFGQTDFGQPIQQTFTVENQGAGDLQLGLLTVPAGFSIVSDFGTTTLAPGSSTTFTVQLDATTPGGHTGEISFGTNDTDEDPYNFTVSGNVLVPEPEIDVLDESFASIADDTGSVDFGQTDFGQPIQQTFTVENQGAGDLQLGTLSLPAGFSIVSEFGTTTLTPGSLTTFTVQLDATASGLISGELSFGTNDTDENPYNFTISGEVLETEPEIDVLDEFSATIADDSDSIDLGFTPVGTPVQYTFTIENQGGSDLTLDPASLTLPVGVSLVGSFPSTVAPLSSDTFTLQLDATFPGEVNGEISFSTNDLDEDLYNFTLTGEVWNLSPVAIDDLYTVMRDLPITLVPVQDPLLAVPAPGVLENDGDADGHPLTATLETGPSQAAAFTFNSDGSFDYQPVSLWTGLDTFTYTVSDGYESSDPATVTISVVSDAAPEIDVSYWDENDTEVFVPDDGGSVDFGETHEGEPVATVFVITNLGVTDLTIDPTSLTVPNGFSVGLEPDSTVAAADWTVMTIVLDAEQTGTYSGQLSFTNNDSDENPYNFTITGTVVAPEPEIEVYDEDFEVVGDDSGDVDVGETTVGNPLEYTFTIDNVGEADLTLDASSVQLPDGFSVVTTFDETVEPFLNTELTVQLDAVAAGFHTGELSFYNNDSDEDPYNFTVSGNVVDSPTLWIDLDDDDSSGMTGADYFTEWNEGQGPVNIEDVADAVIQSSTSDLEWLDVTITDLTDIGAELLAADTAGTSIAANYDSSTGVLSLTGTDNVANYQQVLRSITYDNTASLPTGYDRTIEFVAFDSVGNVSNLANALVLFLYQAPDQADVTKVEFVTKDKLNLTDVKNANEYGHLDPGSNPNGDVDNDGDIDDADKVRHALIAPAFKGGDRFFPDADVEKPKIGRNIVRVRAYVTNMEIGDKVYFKAFDVDDPSTDKRIDRNDKNGETGGDNRGSGGGRLRAVPADNKKIGTNFLSGTVISRVKQLVDKDGTAQTDPAGNPILVAEVDMRTSFAPGDNYRVYAVPERLRALMTRAHTKATGEGRIETNENSPYNTIGDDPRLTSQLSVWRYLHVEKDTNVDVYGLMKAGTVNRQDNRFADAYIEPEYDAVKDYNEQPPATDVRLGVNLTTGFVNKNHEHEIKKHIGSGKFEAPAFWVVYVINGFRSVRPGELHGVTLNQTSSIPYEASVVFSRDIQAAFPTSFVDARNKVAVHEVAHQILQPGGPGDDKNGHRGKQTEKIKGKLEGSIPDYYRAAEEDKFDDKWVDSINIMTADAQAVPMNNGTNALPGEPDAVSGPVDRFYFHPLDVYAMRGLVKSPGKK